MAMSKSVGVGSIVVGCLLLLMTLISVICGGVAISFGGGYAASSIGLAGLYFAMPGVLSIVAGHKKKTSLLAVALGTHIFGMILGANGLAAGATYWSLCFNYPYTCTATGVATITFAFFTILSLTGLIYASRGTCCAREEPVEAVTTAPQQPATVVMTTQAHPANNPQAYSVNNQQPYPTNNQQPYPAYNQQPYPAYNQQPYPAYNPQLYPTNNQQAYPPYNPQAYPANDQPPPPYDQPGIQGQINQGQVVDVKP